MKVTLKDVERAVQLVQLGGVLVKLIAGNVTAIKALLEAQGAADDATIALIDRMYADGIAKAEAAAQGDA